MNPMASNASFPAMACEGADIVTDWPRKVTRYMVLILKDAQGILRRIHILYRPAITSGRAAIDSDDPLPELLGCLDRGKALAALSENALGVVAGLSSSEVAL